MIKIMHAFIVAVNSAAVMGCSHNGSGPSTAGNKKHTQDAVDIVANDSFRINASAMTIKQGESIREIIGIVRGSIFDQDIDLAFENLPPGLILDTVNPVIRNNQEGARLSWSARDEIAPGVYTVRVNGHSVNRADVSDHFQVTVLRRDTFTLSMSHDRNVLNRGETRAFTIQVVGEKQFAEDVTVSFVGLPMGVTAQAGAIVVKYGHHDVETSLHADSNAALGNHDIKVIGHPTHGPDAVHIFKIIIGDR